MISMGNSLPSLRRPMSSIPVPICCARASAAERMPSAMSRSAKPSGMMFLTFCPTSSSRLYPNCFSACTFSRTISPAMVHDHHGIRSGFQQPTIAALHLCQMRFGVPAHADVADGRGDQDSFGAFERAQHDLDGKLAAVFAPRR